MSRILNAGNQPLTVAECLRRMAAEERDRRRLESAQDHLDCLAAEPILHSLNEFQQHRTKVGV